MSVSHSFQSPQPPRSYGRYANAFEITRLLYLKGFLGSQLRYEAQAQVVHKYIGIVYCGRSVLHPFKEAKSNSTIIAAHY